ncbi:flippase [Flagellimonas myxillae]|uniref:flippase n=1 Tax=Flagellimonas myxillae TaxID=2942214 RepID=UPI00201ED3E3|nr:flippase [Muricauda myxillae]MCL6266667.1 flippase [Muricauda myxillae]
MKVNLTKDGDKKEILSKGFLFLIIRLLGLFAGYTFTYLVVKFYGTEVYGLVVLCFSLFVFSGVLGRLGIDVNLVKFYSSPENGSEKGLFFRVVLKSIVVSSIIALALYWSRHLLSEDLFNKPDMEPFLFWLTVSIPFWSLTLVCAGYLRALKMNHWFAFFNNSGRFVLTVIILAVLWSLSDNPLDAIRAHTYGVITLSVLAFALCVKKHGGITLKTQQNTWFFLKESFPMMLSASMIILLGWVDTFVLGIYENQTEIGIYNVALKIATFTSFTLQAINSILAPKLAKSYKEGNTPSFTKLIRFSTKINFFITIAVVALLVLSHHWILSIFGKEFLGGSIILIVLCGGQLVNSFAGSVGVILQMTGKQKVFQNIVLTALFLNIILNFALIPEYGGLGAAIATAASMACRNVLAAGYLKSKMGIVSYYNFK